MKVKYKFCDGTEQEVEIGDELYAAIQKIERYERRLYWRDAKYRYAVDSLENYLEKNDLDIESAESTPLDILMRKENVARVRNAMALLSDGQRALVEKVFFEGLRPLDIAISENTTKQAINSRLNKIYEKILSFLL